MSNVRGTLDFDRCHPSTPKDREATLFASFKTWAADDNRRGMTSTTFRQRLKQTIQDLARQDLKALEDGKEGQFFASQGDTHYGHLEQLARDGHLRRKVEGVSVRRLPFEASRAEQNEADLDRYVRQLDASATLN